MEKACSAGDMTGWLGRVSTGWPGWVSTGCTGGRCAAWLFGPKAWKNFSWLQGITVVLGAVLNTGTVWLLAETINGLMAVPNLLALAMLSPELIRLVKTYTKEPGGSAAKGGTYEYFHQRKPL